MKCEINLGAGFVLGAIAVILFQIFRKPTDPGGVHHVDFEFEFPDNLSKIKTGVNTFMAEIKEGQILKFKVKPKTRRGNPAAIEPGSAVCTSTDDSVVSIVRDPADPDNELAYQAEGLDGSENETVAVEFRADGKRGEGERQIVIAGALTCTQGDAVTGDIEFGTPEDVPDEPTDPGEPPAEPPTEPLPGEPPAEPATGNPSEGAGGPDASGTTDPSASNQPADQGGKVMTVQEGGADTAARNADAESRQSDSA